MFNKDEMEDMLSNEKDNAITPLEKIAREAALQDMRKAGYTLGGKVYRSPFPVERLKTQIPVEGLLTKSEDGCFTAQRGWKSIPFGARDHAP